MHTAREEREKTVVLSTVCTQMKSDSILNRKFVTTQTFSSNRTDKVRYNYTTKYCLTMRVNESNYRVKSEFPKMPDIITSNSTSRQTDTGVGWGVGGSPLGDVATSGRGTRQGSEALAKRCDLMWITVIQVLSLCNKLRLFG